jgi:hypothetical protein
MRNEEAEAGCEYIHSCVSQQSERDDDPSSPHMAKDRPMNIGLKKGPTHKPRARLEVSDLQGPSLSTLGPHFAVRDPQASNYGVSIDGSWLAMHEGLGIRTQL